MLKRNYFSFLMILTILSLNFYQEQEVKNYSANSYHLYNSKVKNNDSILLINKINLLIKGFDQTSLEEGLQVHQISANQNNALVIMGHSGIGQNALFNDLDKLKVNDEIVIIKNNHQRTYLVEEIYWHQKGDKLKIINDFKHLYLVTCDKLNMQKQLIISSKMVKNEEN